MNVSWLVWSVVALAVSWGAERWWAVVQAEVQATEISSCPHCQPKLPRWNQWLLLQLLRNRGRCLNCGRRYASVVWGFPLVLWFGYWLSQPAIGWPMGQELLLIWSLLLLAVIDWHTMWIDYRIVTLALALHFTGLLLSSPAQLSPALLGMTLGAGGLYLLGMLYEALRGRVGLGEGDPAVLALIGAWTGPEALLGVVLLAAISGTLLGGGWLWRSGQNWQETPLPFAPFLCLGGLLMHGANQNDLLRWIPLFSL